MIYKIRLYQRIKKRLQGVTSAMLGEPCLFCQGLDGVDRGVCHRCLASLPWQPPGCHHCGVASDADSGLEPICHRCRSSPPPFDLCRAVFSYQHPVSFQITRFKDNRAFHAGRVLGRLLADSMAAHYQFDTGSMPELLLPVPLHADRLRLRGFNQASILADCVGRRLGLNVVHQSCQRQAGCHSQRGLNSQSRMDNLGKMFTKNRLTRLTSGRHVAIIDDVVTTTATSRDMARVFRDAGTRRIDIWAMAQRNLTLSDTHTYEL